MLADRQLTVSRQVLGAVLHFTPKIVYKGNTVSSVPVAGSRVVVGDSTAGPAAEAVVVLV